MDTALRSFLFLAASALASEIRPLSSPQPARAHTA